MYHFCDIFIVLSISVSTAASPLKKKKKRNPVNEPFVSERWM